MENKRCVLCGKYDIELDDSNPLTIEHIIPKALGNNSLKSYCLCKSCNSKLGEKIDADFINSFDMQLIRKQMGIKGRNGKPNPFKKGQDASGHDIFVDDNMCPRIATYVETDENKIQIHTSSREDAKRIAQTILSRRGQTQDQIDIVLKKLDTIESKQYSPEISYNIEINFRKRLLAILKIAYEYACYKLDDSYYNDNRANDIRCILQQEIDNCDEKEENLNIGIEIAPSEMKEVIDSFHKICPQHHLLILQSDELNRMIATISLFGLFENTYIVLLSNDASKYLSNNDDLTDVIEIVTEG